MEERKSPIEVPQFDDLAAEMKRSCENECTCGNRETHDVSMPICFLVKEQAKSLVAIQELQNRVDNLESNQEDVINAFLAVRNFLSNDSKSFSSLNFTPDAINSPKSPTILAAKLNPFSNQKFHCSPKALKASTSYSSKEYDQITNEIKLPNKTTAEHSQKLLDLAKSKDSALESDKQDSGLDSDCREQNDAHPSLSKHLSNWTKTDSGDELLQLLDEINEKSEVLQKQLAAVEDSIVQDEKQTAADIHTNSNELQRVNSMCENRDILKSKLVLLKTTNHNLACENKSYHLCNTVVETHDTDVDDVPIIAKHNFIVGSPECFMGRSFYESSKMKRSNKIDSAMVSSILKETNAVELQRQVLVYLVENAVLQTKLRETEQMLSSKCLESEKIENGLKDEARLLMMENRELRINLDEQKLEVNALKSKVTMLERVLQSVTAENKELTWHLGESLGLQNPSKRETGKFSSSYTFGSAVSVPNRRSSLSPHFSSQSDVTSCLKTKLLSNTNGFLNMTVEEPSHYLPSQARVTNSAFRYREEPLQSSTPMMPFKHKDMESNVVSSPTNFHSVKKRLMPNNTEKGCVTSKNKLEKCLEENVANSASAETFTGFKLPVDEADEVGKFPFSTILEKLKSNSEYRLSKRIPVAQNDLSTSSCSAETKTPTCSKSKVSFQGPESISQSETKTRGNSQSASQKNSETSNLHGKKGKNIHQRIQDILDRIMAESEEAT